MLRANLRLNRFEKEQECDKISKEIAINMVKTALIFLYDGVEESEFVITLDTLRRAGIQVTVAGILKNVRPIKGCQNILITPDTEIQLCENIMYDVVVIPGGPGYENAEKVIFIFFYIFFQTIIGVLFEIKMYFLDTIS